MTDIVERLRKPIDEIGPTRVLWAALTQRREAADIIERLRAALQPFAYEYDILMQQQDGFPTWHSVKTTHLMEARRALEPKP